MTTLPMPNVSHAPTVIVVDRWKFLCGVMASYGLFSSMGAVFESESFWIGVSGVIASAGAILIGLYREYKDGKRRDEKIDELGQELRAARQENVELTNRLMKKVSAKNEAIQDIANSVRPGSGSIVIGDEDSTIVTDKPKGN